MALLEGYTARSTPMSLGSKRHLLSPNCAKKFKWSCLKVWLHKGHALKAIPMSLGFERHLMGFLHVLENTLLDLGGPLPKPMNMCCYIEYADLNPSFEYNSLSFSPNSKYNISLKSP
jgi:hypothetical protein